MPNNKKKKGGGKAKGGVSRSNAANKDNLAGLDEILSNPEEMAAAQREAVEKGTGYKPRTGRENAQIGLRGFTQATQNPGMFTDAMSMLSDPSAVKEAEAMMNDPEFKSEISQYMETLKNNSAFRDAMADAQRKYQALLSDPAKMKEATDNYNAMMKTQQEAAAKAQGTQVPSSSVPTSAASAGSEGNGVVGGKDATAAKDVGLDDDGEPLGPEAEGLEEDDEEEREHNTIPGEGKAVETMPPPEETSS